MNVKQKKMTRKNNEAKNSRPFHLSLFIVHERIYLCFSYDTL